MRTASLASRAPLVFGNRRNFFRSMKSRMFANGSCLPERSARRNATVTISVPLATIDLVVTSPPYNLGICYSKFSDRADRAGYLHWCKTWAAEIARLLKADGSFFLNVGASPANPMFPHQIVLELRDLFVLQNT